MYVIRVIPVGKSILKDELSYFSKKKYVPGSVVEIPVRNKKMYGIIKDVESARDAKAELRGSTFELKQLKDTAKVNALLSASFTKAATECALYHAHHIGTMLDSLIPTKILAHIEKIPPAQTQTRTENATPEKLVFQDDTERRADHYRALVRESFARGESIFIMVAHKSDGARLETYLKKGIEDYFINFSRTLSEKDMVELFTRARNIAHPILIIGTGKYLSVERHDLKTILIEHESSRGYRTLRRPYTDYRVWAEIYAREIGARLMYGDTMLRVETVGRLYKGELQEHIALKRKLSLPQHIELVDMREKMTKINYELPALSDIMRTAILTAHEHKEKIVIISARKGLSPVTYCKDCGSMITCPHCGAGMVLHGGKGGNFFLCHKCGERGNADTTCAHCGSWNLIAYGTGIEKVEKELLALLPKDQVVRLDKDTAPTITKAKEKITLWQNGGTVLLGTERALSFLYEAHIHVPSAGISGIDALFSIPDFRIYERIFSLIVSLGSITQTHLTIDTRNPEHPLFNAIVRNDLMSFYREELALRTQLSYPPESIFIKISLSGNNKESVVKEIEGLTDIIKERELIKFPALTKKKGLYTMHALLKVPQEKWPDAELSRVLSLLPPRFIVHVDPDSLLS